MIQWNETAATSLILRTGFAMLSTVDWPEEMSSEFQTDGYSTDGVTTSSESISRRTVSLLPLNSVLASIGFLGTFTSGLVLFGFWRSDRSRLSSTSVHIINHTALELSTFALTYIFPPSTTCGWSVLFCSCCQSLFFHNSYALIRPLCYLLVWWQQRNLQWLQQKCLVDTPTQVPVQWLCAFWLMVPPCFLSGYTEERRAWSSSHLTATGRSFTRSIIASTTVAGCSTSGCFCRGWTALLCACLSCLQQPKSSTEDAMRWHSGRHQSWERFACHGINHRRSSTLRLEASGFRLERRITWILHFLVWSRSRSKQPVWLVLYIDVIGPLQELRKVYEVWR